MVSAIGQANKEMILLLTDLAGGGGIPQGRFQIIISYKILMYAVMLLSEIVQCFLFPTVISQGHSLCSDHNLENLPRAHW